MAIGGLRSAPAAVARLHTVAAFGRKLGTQIMDLIMSNEQKHTSEDTLNESWISRTCNAIGSTDPDAGPPPDAVAAVRSMLIEATGMVRDDIGARRLTKVDAHLLEAWRVLPFVIANGKPIFRHVKWSEWRREVLGDDAIDRKPSPEPPAGCVSTYLDDSAHTVVCIHREESHGREVDGVCCTLVAGTPTSKSSWT